MTSLKVGVLALQGAFAEHATHLRQSWPPGGTAWESFALEVVEVRKPSDLKGLNGLILPGGESTTMSKFLERNNFQETLNKWRMGNGCGKPVIWGTCAGLILLANDLEEKKAGGQLTLGGLDITATRNSFGRQAESFEIELRLHCPLLEQDKEGDRIPNTEDVYHGVFIRAPGIKSVNSPAVKILATMQNKDGETRSVAVQQGSLMATSFHPELTDDLRWHRYFLHLVRDSRVQTPQ